MPMGIEEAKLVFQEQGVPVSYTASKPVDDGRCHPCSRMPHQRNRCDARNILGDIRWDELASGSLGKETKEEMEDELASGSRAWEKGKEDPTSGSLGKEAKVEKEDKLASDRALEKDKELPSLDSDSSVEEAKEDKEDKQASGRAEVMKEPASGGSTTKAKEQNQGLATGSEDENVTAAQNAECS